MRYEWTIIAYIDNKPVAWLNLKTGQIYQPNWRTRYVKKMHAM